MHFIVIFLSAVASLLWIDLPLTHLFVLLAPLKGLCLSYTWVCLPALHLFFATFLFLFCRLLPKFKSYSFFAFQYLLSVGFIMFFCGILKLAVARARPYLLIENGVSGFFFKDMSNAFRSFPSSHVAIAMAILVILSTLTKKPSKLYLWGFVLAIAFSRLILLRHFTSDILFGALIGYLTTWSVVSLSQKYKFWIYQLVERIF